MVYVHFVIIIVLLIFT